MFPRTLSKKILDLVKQFPVIAILGPRQSGKTTLARTLFPEYRYINLESFEEREFAEEDPKGFLERFRNDKGVILDEIQKAPKILSYLQMEVDEFPIKGRFILTGSHNILLNHHVSQTLAGRVALTTLLPFSIQELREAKHLPKNAFEAIFSGFYPRIYQDKVDPVVFYDSYLRTYVERDVRDIKQIVSLTEFQKFLRLCAGRIGQLLNYSSLAVESGLTLATVKSWLSILEASYVIFLLQPYHVNFNKRVVKMPKLYFYDTGLAAHLLRLQKEDDVYNHYLKGGLFESMVVSDFVKNRFHHALPLNLYFWRDKMGHEIDCLQEEGNKINVVEIKASGTINLEMFEGIAKWADLTGTPPEKAMIVYAGHEEQKRKQGHVIPWSAL